MKTNLENYEERFVDYMEGQLSADEMHEVEAFVAQHPELEEDFKLFCSTKLEPDTHVVYTKKESLMRPSTVVRPLFLRIAAAAACVALLIGIGIRFLKPHQSLEQQIMLAGLTPITAKPIDVQQEIQELRKSDVKPISTPKKATRAKEVETIMDDDPSESIAIIQPVELITAIPSIEPKNLEWDKALAYDDIEIRMDVELGERLSTMGPLADVPFEINVRDFFFSNLGKTTKELYKKTAKTVMDVYYTADYRINETKEELIVSR